MTSSTTPTGIFASSFSFWSAMNKRRHDVFLSFRGEDTRDGMIHYLHRALEDAGIQTYKDDEKLEKGREISSELLQAIQISRISIIVFSRNYATSGWCLDELVKILECKREDGQVVVPVFYDVDAEDVRGQRSGSSGNALSRHEERFREMEMASKVEIWKSALKEAGSFSGWDLEINYWHQSTFIKEIIKEILSRSQEAHLSLSIPRLGIDSGKEYLNLLLSVTSEDVLVIGIYGIDRIGMSELARAAYNQNSNKFDASCFLSHVSIISQQPNGLIHLQSQFLSDILAEDGLQIESVERGIDMIKTSLCNRRVLAVFNDLDKLEQLNALARSRKWFGSGSRILITTDDAQLLSVLEVEDVYGDQGIQIIQNKFRKNLKIIEGLEEFIHRSHIQAERKLRSLAAEIETERRKNATRAREISALLRRRNENLLELPLIKVATTTDNVMNGDGVVLEAEEIDVDALINEIEVQNIISNGTFAELEDLDEWNKDWGAE